MKVRSPSSRRYAKALVRLSASNPEKAKNCLDGLAGVRELLLVPKAREIIESPAMPQALKFELLQYGLHTCSHDQMLENFLKYLITSGRVNQLAEILDVFKSLVDELQSNCEVEVVSSVKLSDQQVNAIKESLGKDRNYTLVNKVEPQLLGGVLVKMDDQQIDLSVRSKLRDFGRQLSVTDFR